MELYQAPTPVPPSLDLFLAGGISNCPNWQALMLSSLSDLAISVANPRRDAYDYAMDEARQVEWEHHALNRSKCVSFWFPEETLCPITLFELGRFASQTQTPIFVGLHPRYGRHVNVTTQLRLARPGQKYRLRTAWRSLPPKSKHTLAPKAPLIPPGPKQGRLVLRRPGCNRLTSLRRMKALTRP